MEEIITSIEITPEIFLPENNTKIHLATKVIAHYLQPWIYICFIKVWDKFIPYETINLTGSSTSLETRMILATHIYKIFFKDFKKGYIQVLDEALFRIQILKKDWEIKEYKLVLRDKLIKEQNQ